MQATQFELLNTRTFSAGQYHTAIMPIGFCESHGDHLPFGMDALTAHALALRVGAKVPGSMVLPPTFFGMSHHYRHQPMTISLSIATTTALFREIFESLALVGIQRIFVLNDHDGNMTCWETAARRTKLAYPGSAIAGVDWWVPVGQLCPPELFEVWSGWGLGSGRKRPLHGRYRGQLHCRLPGGTARQCAWLRPRASLRCWNGLTDWIKNK